MTLPQAQGRKRGGLCFILNEEAFLKLRSVKRLEVVPGATHLFEEKGALEQVAFLAKAWFAKYL